MESEREGVTIYWDIENINIISEGNFVEIEFNWPQSEKKCNVAVLFNPLGINFILIYGRKRCNFERISGTFFEMTGEEYMYEIGRLENWNASRSASKHFGLRRDENFRINYQKDVLKFRIHLWNNGTEKIKRVQYYFCSRIFHQKFSLPCNVKIELDAVNTNLNEVFRNYETDLNLDFLNEYAKKTFSTKLILRFEYFLSKYGRCQVRLKGHARAAFIKCLLTVEDSAKKPVTFGKILKFERMDTRLDIPMCMTLEELKVRKTEFYPNGELCLTCNFTVYCAPSFLERVHYGIDESHFNWQKDNIYSKELETTKCISISVEEKMTMKDSVFNLYKNGKLCDVSLLAGDANFPCHKIVLYARSHVFKAIFDNDMREKESSVLDIDDVDPYSLGLFLDSLYTDSIPVMNWKSVLNLYVISDKYNVLAVKKRCAVSIEGNISLTNVCEVLIFADRHQDQSMKRAAQLFFSKYAKKTVFSSEYIELMQRHPFLAAETMREALLKNLLQRI